MNLYGEMGLPAYQLVLMLSRDGLFSLFLRHGKPY